MSRIGREPVEMPAGVTLTADNGLLTVKGPLGTLTQDYDVEHISFKVEGNVAHVYRNSEEDAIKAKHGEKRIFLTAYFMKKSFR